MNESRILSMWKELLIICLITVSIFLWNRWQTEKIESNSIKAQLDIQKKIDGINAKVEEIKLREKDLYPLLNANILKLNKDIKDLEKIRNDLEKLKPTKEGITNELKDLTLEEISKRLIESGYDNTIITSPSK